MSGKESITRSGRQVIKTEGSSNSSNSNNSNNSSSSSSSSSSNSSSSSSSNNNSIDDSSSSSSSNNNSSSVNNSSVNSGNNNNSDYNVNNSLSSIILIKQLLKSINENQTNKQPFPEESKFDGRNKYKFDKSWDYFEFLFNHHFGNTPSSYNLISSLKGQALDCLRSIDPFNTRSVEENLKSLKREYQVDGTILLSNFVEFVSKNKFQSLYQLLLTFDIVRRRVDLSDEAAIVIINNALGENFKELLAIRGSFRTSYKEHIDKVKEIESAYSSIRSSSLYLYEGRIPGVFGTSNQFPSSVASTSINVSEEVNNMSTIKCFNCGDNHYARDCKKKNYRNNNSNNNRSYNNNYRNNNNNNINNNSNGSYRNHNYRNNFNRNNYSNNNNNDDNNNDNNNNNINNKSYSNDNQSNNIQIDNSTYGEYSFKNSEVIDINPMNLITNISNNNNAWANLNVNNKGVRMLVDTGASLCCIKESLAKKLDLQLLPSSTKVKSASNHQLSPIGKAIGIVSFSKVKKEIPFEVFKDTDISVQCILGLNALKVLKLDPILSVNILYNKEINCRIPLYQYVEPIVETPIRNESSINHSTYESLIPESNNIFRVNTIIPFISSASESIKSIESESNQLICKHHICGPYKSNIKENNQVKIVKKDGREELESKLSRKVLYFKKSFKRNKKIQKNNLRKFSIKAFKLNSYVSSKGYNKQLLEPDKIQELNRGQCYNDETTKNINKNVMGSKCNQFNNVNHFKSPPKHLIKGEGM